MNKKDLQSIYNRIKTRQTMKPSSFFSGKQMKKGCSSCGKSSWRPNHYSE